ncbi:putative CRAL-TRIO lipid binding domain-containing protein [Helianthus annuus]|nr:putative CRAL-TRIO lipid binding domain-containing protein [Helianthus annuus]
MDFFVEYGVLNLLAPERPQMTVLLDCEGLSPFGFPVTTFRSCAILLQDHYPNRLGSLLVVRLPSVARVITQTLFQVSVFDFVLFSYHYSVFIIIITKRGHRNSDVRRVGRNLNKWSRVD